jgi:hypothetical protein
MEAGFYNGASARILDQLFFQDVSMPLADETRPEPRRAAAESA